MSKYKWLGSVPLGDRIGLMFIAFNTGTFSMFISHGKYKTQSRNKAVFFSIKGEDLIY